MLKVVSNTTPLIALLKLDRLRLLKQLYDEIYIPTAVYNEFEAGKNKDFYSDLSKIPWIHISEVSNKATLNSLPNLDDGEAEAIVLATELNANLILLDEKLGRSYAKNLGLNIIGTIGILMKAKREGLIEQLKPLLDELIQKGFWINEKFKIQILNRLGEY